MASNKTISTYFSHDSNARNSTKLIALRMKYGAAGYGVFFMILERLREEPNYTCVRDYNVIAFDLHESNALIKSVIEDFGLFSFTEDGKYFYSESFNRRMEKKDEKSATARKNANAKWGNTNNANYTKRSERLSAARQLGTHDKSEWDEMKSIIGHCVICGKSADEVEIVKDHIIPIYQGGSDGIWNIQPLCRSCNSRKGADATDYRSIYCQNNNIEMPTKWVQNACKTPAIKVKERKEKKIETLSKSLSSFESERVESEREDFFQSCCDSFLSDAEREYQEHMAMKYGITDLAGAFQAFRGKLVEFGLLGEVRTKQDFKRLFVYKYCMPLNQQNSQKQDEIQREDRFSKRRGVNKIAHRPEDYSGSF